MQRPDTSHTRGGRRLAASALAATAAAVCALAGGARGAEDPKPAYLDTSLSFEARARDLVSRMTAEEKISELTNQAIGIAATFDAPLVHQMAVVISDEARARHHQFVRQGRRARASVE